MMYDFSNYRLFLLKVAKNNLKPSLHSWAEDIVQDTFLKAERNIGSYNEDKGKLSTWLAQITTNLCRDFIKKKVNNELCYADINTHLSNLVWKDKQMNRNNLRPYFEQMIPRYKIALLLKYNFDMSAKEMAKHLDISPASVPVLIQRAKANLKTILENDDFDYSDVA